MVGDGHWRPCDPDRPLQPFAFVPHIDNRGGPNAIFQFKFDPNTGHLTPNSPPRVGQPTGTGPRHFCFHPSKDLLYFSNEQGSSVTGYHFDPATGTLSAFQTISTLPTGYEESNTCSQIQMTPSGQFLYAPRPQQHRGLRRRCLRSVDGHRARRNRPGPAPSAWTLRAISCSPPVRRRTAWHRTGSTAIPVRSRPWRRIPWARGPCGY